MISDIFENQSLCMENVLHYRGRITRQESAALFSQIEQLLSKEKAQKSGPTVTVTYAVEMHEGTQIMDMEVFIPLNKTICPQGDFAFIPKLQIPNALRIRVEGNPEQLETATQLLSSYIQSHHIQPITPACVVTVKTANTPLELDEMITDIYVGVKA